MVSDLQSQDICLIGPYACMLIWTLQVNALQQLENIAGYPFLREKLDADKVRLHALWFDIHDGDFYMFSRSQQRFLHVTDEHYQQLIADSEAPNE